MIVKTDKVKEKGFSIGMFSRGGKATTLLDINFRDKNDEEKMKKIFLGINLDENEADDENKTKYSRPTTSLSDSKGSFYFNSISREKHPIFKREKTPDSGIYRPKYESIHSRTSSFIYRPSTSSVISNTSTDEIIKKDKRILPSCLIDGNTCNFKIRDMKRQINKIREQINNSNIDLKTLYNERIIDQKDYNLFKSPSLTLLEKFENQPKTNSALLALQQNPNQLIELVNEYHSLKSDMSNLLAKNIQDLGITRMNIADRPRTTSQIPLNLGKQLSRPNYSRLKNDFYTDYSMNTSFMNEAFHKIHKFESTTPRKVFISKNKSLCEYDITNQILDKTRPVSRAFIDIKQYYPRKLPTKSFLNTSVDVVDVNEQIDKLGKTSPVIAEVSKGLGRSQHKFRETDLSVLKRSPYKNAQNTSISFFEKTPGVQYSFMSPIKFNI